MGAAEILQSHESFHLLDRDLSFLFEQKYLAKEPTFLRRIAITIRQIHFELPGSSIDAFVSQPLTDSRITLLEAADKFSEQDPRHSDLSNLLWEISTIGPLFIRLPRAAACP